MTSRRHGSLLIACACCTLLLAACSNREEAPKALEYPYFEPPDDNARELTCLQIDSALRRVDAVRWSMRQDDWKAYSRIEKVGQSIVGAGMSVLLFPIDPVNASVLGAGSVANPFMDDMVTAADGRIVGLLKIKADENCVGAASGHEGKTDLDVFAELTLLGERCYNDELSERECIDERTGWLDMLYPQIPLTRVTAPALP